MSGSSSPSPDDYLLIGTLGLPFGIKGQIKLHAVTSRPEQLRKVKTLYLGDKYRPVGLRRATEHKANLLLLTIEGVDDRNTAETLRNLEVFIRESDAAPLEEDEYFLHDLPGLMVETVNGEPVGTVKDVLETGANDVLIVTRPGGGEVLIPMIRDVVKALDLNTKRLVIEPIEGLLE